MVFVWYIKFKSDVYHCWLWCKACVNIVGLSLFRMRGLGFSEELVVVAFVESDLWSVECCIGTAPYSPFRLCDFKTIIYLTLKTFYDSFLIVECWFILQGGSTENQSMIAKSLIKRKWPLQFIWLSFFDNISDLLFGQTRIYAKCLYVCLCVAWSS